MKWSFYLVVFACLIITQTWAKTLQYEEEEEEEDQDVAGGYDNVIEDPCSQKQCGAGKECDLDDERKAVCVCVHKCPPEAGSKVCSTHNVTFDSECELYRQKCLCHRGHPECQDRKYKKAHIDYFGPCKEIAECTDPEMEEYPERMRSWLYHVMEELARRDDLSQPALRMAQEAERHPKKWVLPVIWKFCDLDASHDMQMSARELMPISAQLKPLEHCTGPFLDRCDADQSGYISLQEWGHCLGLEDDEIEDRCERMRT